MNIRKARHEDLNAIVGLLADDKLGAGREDFQIPLPQSYALAFENIVADSNQELMVVESDTGNITGTLQLSFIQYLTYRGGVRAQIEAVRIHKDYRNQGLGRRLFEWAIARAREKKAHVLQLTTDKKRPEALAFYKSLGFTDSHEGMKLHF
jgi:ribosomal protein S18 acetylase RimI-like enzyme